jgi:hypothetical protein
MRTVITLAIEGDIAPQALAADSISFDLWIANAGCEALSYSGPCQVLDVRVETQPAVADPPAPPSKIAPVPRRDLVTPAKTKAEIRHEWLGMRNRAIAGEIRWSCIPGLVESRCREAGGEDWRALWPKEIDRGWPWQGVDD